MPAISIKDYIYAGAIVALLIAFGWYTSHERSIGADKIKAQDAEIVSLTNQHNTDVTALAMHATAKNGDTYVATTHQPIPDSPSVVCVKPHSANVMPEAPSRPGLPDAAADSAKTNSVDIGPPLDTAGRNADALITALQTEVKILVDAMNGVTAP